MRPGDIAAAHGDALEARLRALNLPEHHRRMFFDADDRIQAYWLVRPIRLATAIGGYELVKAAGFKPFGAERLRRARREQP